MCEMLDRLMKKSEAKGRAEGEAKGRAEGEAIGEARGEAKGRAEGEAKEKGSFAVRMLEGKEPVAKIIEYTQLTFAQIQEIAKSIGVAVVM